jgi:KaiC/GvpD/RAD55 family RecA-like ATPase
MRRSSGPKGVFLIVLALAIALAPSIPSAAAPLTQQPSTFFFHKQSTKTLNTITTNLWANTTKSWSATNQNEQRSVSSSTPGIWHFYSQPAIAGNTTITGPLTFVLYFSSSSGTGTGTVITGNLNKITSSGTVVSLAVGSLSSASISSTLTGYTITITSNTYQIETGAILDFAVTVNIPGSTSRTISLYYDAPSNSSEVSITFQQRVGITSYSSYNQTGIQTSFFSRNWTATSRQATLRATIFDALGLYDLASIRANLTSPTGSPLLTSTPLIPVQGTALDYVGIWSVNWTYSSNDRSGAYGSSLGATDDGGLPMTTQLSFTVFASWILNLQALSLDPTPVPVPGASVTIFAGSAAIYNGATDSSGSVSPQNILLLDNATYNLKTFWQGSLVNQTLSYVPRASRTIILHLSVYQVDFSTMFKDGNGNPLPQPPSDIQLSYPNGTSASLVPTGAYLLPAGTYSISTVTWMGVNVAASSITFNPMNGLSPVNLQIYDLTVLVLGQDGSAAAGATVTLTLSGRTIVQTTTGSNGVLLLRDLPKGQYVIEVSDQSQTVRSIINLSQNTSSNIQFNSAPSSWVTQSVGWIILGAAAGGLLGYGEFYKKKHPYREEPIEYLNGLTSGGFRDGDIVLIEGDTGTGKTTICQELAYKALQSGNPVAYLTYDNPESARLRMKNFHWDTSEYEQKQQFQLIGCELTKTLGEERGLGVLENFYDTTALDLTISTALFQLSNEKPVVLVDSAYQLVERARLNGLANMVLETSARIKRMKGKFFLAVTKTDSKSGLAELEGAVDSIITLDTTTAEGQTQFTVKKMRGRKFDNRPVRIKVHPRKGVVFLVPKTAKHKPQPSNS